MHYSTAVKVIEHRDDILKMRKEGVPISELSAEYHMYPVIISRILKDDGIYEEAKAIVSERDEILKMRLDGASIKEIADKYYYAQPQITKMLHDGGIDACMRGRKFNINRIRYQGVYDHFVNNPEETVVSFSRKIYSHNPKCDKIRYFLTGKHESTIAFPVIKRMCEVVGKPFEETFAPREVEE